VSCSRHGPSRPEAEMQGVKQHKGQTMGYCSVPAQKGLVFVAQLGQWAPHHGLCPQACSMALAHMLHCWLTCPWYLTKTWSGCRHPAPADIQHKVPAQDVLSAVPGEYKPPNWPGHNHLQKCSQTPTPHQLHLRGSTGVLESFAGCLLDHPEH
jgi:hypothetical protein